MIDGPYVYIIERSATGDTTHATTSFQTALQWLRHDRKPCSFIILDYQDGQKLFDCDLEDDR